MVSQSCDRRKKSRSIIGDVIDDESQDLDYVLTGSTVGDEWLDLVTVTIARTPSISAGEYRLKFNDNSILAVLNPSDVDFANVSDTCGVKVVVPEPSSAVATSAALMLSIRPRRWPGVLRRVA